MLLHDHMKDENKGMQVVESYAQFKVLTESSRRRFCKKKSIYITYFVLQITELGVSNPLHHIYWCYTRNKTQNQTIHTDIIITLSLPSNVTNNKLTKLEL